MKPDTTQRELRVRGPKLSILEILRRENTGGILLAITVVVALVWANSPAAGTYDAIRDFAFGPSALHLHLSVAQWCADGLLTVFFFLVGIELKREFTVGELNSVRKATLPVVAAVGGMTAPALIYLAFNLTSADGASSGWAVPVATDIAFSVAVLGLVSSHIPRSLRIFLLTLAVADDLLGILVIAIFYNSGGLNLLWLLACVAAVVVFGFVVGRGIINPLILLPIGVVAWYCMHSSGVHATIAGVLMGFMVPSIDRVGESQSVANRLITAISPVTYGLVVPIFALMTAGVAFNASSIAGALADPVAWGVTFGLVVGKPLGICLATWLMITFAKSALDKRLSMWDILAVGEVAGIGFTVSLLIKELAFPDDPVHGDHGTMAVLVGSLTAALLGAALMSWRNWVHKKREAAGLATDTDTNDAEDRRL